MNVDPNAAREVAKGAGRLIVHALSIVLGLILSVVGIAMGVSIALLPIGIPVGLAGLVLLMWGLFGGTQTWKYPPYLTPRS
jgi:hypothetical protein